MTNRSIEEINHIIAKASGKGKIKLERIFKEIQLTLDTGTKEMLVRLIEKIPDKIDSILNKVKEQAQRKPCIRRIFFQTFCKRDTSIPRILLGLQRITMLVRREISKSG